jgi:O-acetylhomoserine (thiol)-lyase
METLGVRMEKHVSNTRAVVDFLNSHDAVAGVAHPDLSGHPDHALASELYPKGTSAVFTFEIKGGRDAGIAFVNGLSLFSHLANVGDAKSLVIHPASTTHFRMDEAALAAAGIGEGTIRLSVGLEDPKDLITDLKAGLRAAEKVAGGRS